MDNDMSKFYKVGDIIKDKSHNSNDDVVIGFRQSNQWGNEVSVRESKTGFVRHHVTIPGVCGMTDTIIRNGQELHYRNGRII